MNAMRCWAWTMAIGTGLMIVRAGAQGELDPAAPPGPTMKTLAQIEPRIPIASLPFLIEQPGSYYLVSNLTASGYGIFVATNGVTLDLMGFSIVGDGDTVDCGIAVDGSPGAPVCGAVVRNGTVRNFGNGIKVEDAIGGRFERLALVQNTVDGVWFHAVEGKCNANVLSECAIGSNALYGIGWSVDQGECEGNTIADCTVFANGWHGIYLRGARSGDGITRCDGNAIVRCAVVDNAFSGIVLDGSGLGRCAGNRIADCTVSGNRQYGIFLDAHDSGACRGNMIAGCAVAGNADDGIRLSGFPDGSCDGNAVVGCVVHRNGDDGIDLNLARGNRVEGNHLTGQSAGYGISCQATSSNLLLRNSAVGNSPNYLVVDDDVYGPAVGAQGELADTGAPTHPWANFTR